MLSNGFAIGQRHTNQTICQNKFDFDKALNSANEIISIVKIKSLKVSYKKSHQSFLCIHVSYTDNMYGSSKGIVNNISFR